MIKLGHIELSLPVLLAPMAGVTDLPYRTIARRFGAEYCVAEMISSKRELAGSRKSNFRTINSDEPSPRVVQLVGTDPQIMKEAAVRNVALGAEVIDINMGCPAKKVNKVAAGSALMGDESRVARIVQSIVQAVDVPVSVKIRTGLHKEHKNAPQIAKIIEDSGADWLTIHGRTRACGFKGEAEYETIKTVVDCLTIPVIANGDISTASDVKAVLKKTGAHAVMVGRASYGCPWLFNQIRADIEGSYYAVTAEQILSAVSDHLDLIYRHYGDFLGVRIARKHIAWYFDSIAKLFALDGAKLKARRAQINRIDEAKIQHTQTLSALIDVINCDAQHNGVLKVG